MTNLSQQKTWKKAIGRMTKDELQFALEHPDGYYPEFLELANAALKRLSPLPDHEAMKITVKNCLEELGCPCETDEEGDLSFWFQGEKFYILLEDHYLDIWDYCWKSVKLENDEEVDTLKRAVNKANGDCSITSLYTIFEEDQTVVVSSTTSILYRPMIANLKDYLYIRLSNFFLAHEIINSEMLQDKRRLEQQNDSISKSNQGKSSDFLGHNLNDLLDTFFDDKKKTLVN